MDPFFVITEDNIRKKRHEKSQIWEMTRCLTGQSLSDGGIRKIRKRGCKLFFPRRSKSRFEKFSLSKLVQPMRAPFLFDKTWFLCIFGWIYQILRFFRRFGRKYQNVEKRAKSDISSRICSKIDVCQIEKVCASVAQVLIMKIFRNDFLIVWEKMVYIRVF